MSDAKELDRLSSEARVWRFRVFTATWLSYFGFYFCRKPFYITKPALEQSLGLDPTMLGVIGTAYLVAYTIGQFLNGWLGNKLGPRVVVLSGMAVSVVANAAFGFANTWGTFAAFMVVNGLAQATGWSCNVGTMARWFHRRERGTVMGIWATNYQVGGVAANALAAWVLGEFGFRYSYFAGSAVLVLVWGYYLINQRNGPEDVGLDPIEDPEASDEEERLDEERSWTKAVIFNVLLVGTFYFFVKFIRYALWSWAPYLLNSYYGLQLDDAGYVSTIFDLSGIAGVFVAGYLSDKLFSGRRAKISFIFIVAMGFSCFLLYSAGGASLAVFATSIGLIGFSLYGPDALMTGAAAIDVGSRRMATLAAGIINGMGSAGSVVQELYLGVLLEDGDVSGVFFALLACSGAAAFCLAWLLWRNKRGLADL